MKKPTRPPEHLVDRKDLPALRARWSDTVRYEIYLLIGERHDILKIERAVFEMLLGTPGRAEDLGEAHIEDVVRLVCQEHGGPSWFDWDAYAEIHPEPEEEDDAG